jgi:hypothetical protein
MPALLRGETFVENLTLAQRHFAEAQTALDKFRSTVETARLKRDQVRIEARARALVKLERSINSFDFHIDDDAHVKLIENEKSAWVECRIRVDV